MQRTDGDPLNILAYSENFPYLDSSKRAVLWTDSDKLIAVFKTGESPISLSARWNGDHINFDVWVPAEYKHKTKGLLGYYDDNHCNEYRNRNNEVLDCIPVHHINGNSRTISNHMKSCKLLLKKLVNYL